jgi:hypothetical protein
LTLERLALDDSRMVSEAAAATLAEQAAGVPEPEAAGTTHARPADEAAADAAVVPAPRPPAGGMGPTSGVGEPAGATDSPTPRASPAKEPTSVGPPGTAATPEGSAATSAPPGRSRAESRFLLAGALTALGAVLWLAALFEPYIVSSGTGFTIAYADGNVYPVTVLVGLCIAAALLMVPATRTSIGPGFLIGVSTGQISVFVLSTLLPHWASEQVSDSSLGTAYYLALLTALAVVAGAILCASCLPRAGVRLQWLGRTSGWPAWAVAVLGVVAATALLVEVVQASDLPGVPRTFDASIDLPILLTDALMLTVVAIVAAVSTPRRFGVAVLAGWLVAAVSMVAYYIGGQLTLFTILVAAMAAVGVVFARDAEAAAPSAG